MKYKCKGDTSKSNMYDSLTQFVAYVDYIQCRYMCLRDSIDFHILVAKSGAYQAEPPFLRHSMLILHNTYDDDDVEFG